MPILSDTHLTDFTRNCRNTETPRNSIGNAIEADLSSKHDFMVDMSFGSDRLVLVFLTPFHT